MTKRNSKPKDLRLGIERRIFTYTAYIPERRSGKDRRQNPEYRSSNKYSEISEKTICGSKTPVRVQREWAAYTSGCEYFAEMRNPPEADAAGV